MSSHDEGRKMTGKLSHFDEQGAARMVDVSAKNETLREAVAEGRVVMLPGTLSLILDGKVAKGDVFGIARLAGIMAAKKTSELIPLCHPLALSSLDIELEPDKAAILRTYPRHGQVNGQDRR